MATKIDFKKLREAVERHNARLTGKPVKSCNVSGFQHQVLKPTGHSAKRTAVTSQEVELRALACGIAEALGLVDLKTVPGPLLEAAFLAERKATDYNAGVRRSAYFPLGLASYAQELHKKSLRLVSLARRPGDRPRNESVRDTALDMINYACFLVEAIDRGEA